MGVVYRVGQVLGRGDLDLYLTNSVGNPANAYTISYALYYVDPGTSTEVLIGDASRAPVNPAVGEYYVAIQVPTGAVPGDYRVRWTFQETSVSPAQQVVQDFGIVASDTTTSTTLSACEAGLVRSLRIMLRDNNPDKNYRFRPPEHEGKVGCYSQVFGYIWTDEELLEYLRISLDKWNMQAPKTPHLCNLNTLCQDEPSWKAALLWGAVVHAAMALSFNWISEEFSYSIGGISLDIEKSSKYQSLKENAESQWDKLVEMKSRTTKYMRGLQQPKYGAGVRSAFGPATGRGIMSPRSFL